MLLVNRLESEIIDQLTKEVGRRLSSREISGLSIHLFNQQRVRAATNQVSQALLRIAIKANPYDAHVSDLLSVYGEITRRLAQSDMPHLTEQVSRCASRGLPLPVIVSCEKYLAQARQVAEVLKTQYFGIAPIIVRGGADSRIASFDGQVLCLPVCDDYEALPYKVFETWTLIEMLGARHGVIKFDDDSALSDQGSLDLARVRATFERADYMGLALSSPDHDRAWHLGKCASAVPPIYGKPFIAPWARGALYFLSKAALTRLAAHYLRFPGCLDGELYEDKAVGDVLHALGIPLVNDPLEHILGIRTDAPERGLDAAERSTGPIMARPRRSDGLREHALR